MFRVLIVDDEPMIRKGLVKLVQGAGDLISGIRTAENGVEALEMVEQECPHFLFTDIRMPKMDGMELCRRVAEMDENIQIVVISGYSDFEYAQKCLSYGVKEYLLKPINKAAVQETIGKLAARYHKQSVLSSSVAPARLEEWADEMEKAVWFLNHNELNESLEQWHKEYQAFSLSLQQQISLLGQLYKFLLKKLNARDVFSFASELHIEGARTSQEAFEIFSEAIKHLLQHLKSKRKGQIKNPIEEAKLYIEQNLAKEVSLGEVAEVLGLNASYFSQMFKQMTDETFVQYRTKRRMEKAKKLLEMPQYRIIDVSYEVGYADLPHFTKTFKKYTGCLPSEYRQILGME